MKAKSPYEPLEAFGNAAGAGPETTPRAPMDIPSRKARICIGKLCLNVKKEDSVCVDKGSIYGSALVIPQIARSSGWPPRMVILCIRGYIFLAANCFLQWMLVYSLMKEEQVMDKFSGEMWMCNFAAQKEGCPEGPGCMGPGGTRASPERTYSFLQWNVRNYMKNALLSVFPDRRDEINAKVDPGEYGLESLHCRFLCTFLFIVAVTQEFRSSFNLLRLLWCVPTNEDSWVSDNEDGQVELRVQGMPRRWKIFNSLVIVLPKFMLWQFIARTGMIFLIETASIQNTIVNSTALTFILNIDELLFDVFTTAQTKYIVKILEGYQVPEDDEPGERPLSGSRLSSVRYNDLNEAQEQAILEQAGLNRWCMKSSVPWLFFVSLAVWCYFIWVYYSTHCFQSEDGTWVSNPMYLPKGTNFNHLSAFLPQVFPIEHAEKPYWTYEKHYDN